MPFETILVEPLYQLVRQQLLAWRIEQSDFDPAEVVRVLHIAPSDNAEYWQSLNRHRCHLPGETVREVWPRLLCDDYRDRFMSIDSNRFTDEDQALTSPSYRDRYPAPVTVVSQPRTAESTNQKRTNGGC